MVIKKIWTKKIAKFYKKNVDIILEIKSVIEKINVWNHDGIKDAFNEFALFKNLKIKDFGPTLRIALTYSSASAGGIFDVVETLGRDEVIKRLNNI
jgi:glutamyl/glutaminyl-tRNA synthetase